MGNNFSDTHNNSNMNESIEDCYSISITPGLADKDQSLQDKSQSLTEQVKSLTTDLSEQVQSLTTELSEQAQSLTNLLQIYCEKNHTVSSEKSKKLDNFFDLECGLNNISRGFTYQSPYSTSNDVLKICDLSDLECGFNI